MWTIQFFSSPIISYIEGEWGSLCVCAMLDCVKLFWIKGWLTDEYRHFKELH